MDTTAETKRERRLAARAERQRLAEEGRRKAQQRGKLKRVLLIVVGAALLAGLAFLIAQLLTTPPVGRPVASEGNTHVAPGTPLEFKSNPPTSGAHYQSWTRPGVYAEPQDRGNWVHSLEHGYIVIVYNCPSECPDLVQQLRQFYDTAPKSNKYGYQKLVITPYREMASRLAILAWTRIDALEQFDAERLMSFYRAYHDKGPEDAS